MGRTHLRIIGTSHIAQQSIDEIKTAFNEPPAIVALELDPPRLHALLHPELKKPGFLEIAKQVGVRGALFAVLARFAQEKLGSSVGIEPGADMLSAFTLAREHKCKVYLIDQPIALTLRNVSKVPLREKAKMVLDAVFQRDKEMGKIDLRKVPPKKLIETLLGIVKKRYPHLYTALIDDRNAHMAAQLEALMAKHPEEKILVIVGAGHLDGINELLDETKGTATLSYTATS